MWIYFLCCLVGVSGFSILEKPPLSEIRGRDWKGNSIGGYETHIEENPYQVSFTIDNTYYCGGFIIGENNILTAAHCSHGANPSQIILRAGSAFRHNGTIIPIAEVVSHPDYDESTYNMDVAYMVTAAPIVFSHTIRPIALPPRNRPLSGTILITGWGRSRGGISSIPNRVMATMSSLLDHWQCLISYPTVMNENNFCSKNFYLGKEGTCQGDTDGVAVQNGMAVGIVTFTGACGFTLSPSVFANLAAPSIRDFITDNLGL